MKTSCFSFCFHYTYSHQGHNKQKKPRDKILITGPEDVKSFIKTVKMIKSEFEPGKSHRHRAFYQLGQLFHNLLWIFTHIVLDPVEHQPDKNV